MFALVTFLAGLAGLVYSSRSSLLTVVRRPSGARLRASLLGDAPVADSAGPAALATRPRRASRDLRGTRGRGRRPRRSPRPRTRSPTTRRARRSSSPRTSCGSSGGVGVVPAASRSSCWCSTASCSGTTCRARSRPSCSASPRSPSSSAPPIASRVAASLSSPARSSLRSRSCSGRRLRPLSSQGSRSRSGSRAGTSGGSPRRGDVVRWLRRGVFAGAAAGMKYTGAAAAVVLGVVAAVPPARSPAARHLAWLAVPASRSRCRGTSRTRSRPGTPSTRSSSER